MLTYQTFFKGKLGDLRCWCRQFQKMNPLSDQFHPMRICQAQLLLNQELQFEFYSTLLSVLTKTHILMENYKFETLFAITDKV